MMLERESHDAEVGPESLWRNESMRRDTKAIIRR